jgi:hypothetical protein
MDGPNPATPSAGGTPPPDTPKGKPSRDKARKGAPGKARTAGRFRTINAFADFTLRGLDRAEIAVWLLLWRDTRPDGLARTSQADLARRAGVNQRTARRAVGSLCRAKLLTRAYQGGLNRGLSVYRVHPLPTAA